MKFLVLSFAIIWQLLSFNSPAVCQVPETQTGRLHFTFPFPGDFKGRYELAASNAQWVSSDGKPLCAGCERGSILQLRGNVEVQTIVCLPNTTRNVCDKSPIVLRADAIDYNASTGDLQARGVVQTVLMQPTLKKYKSSK